jgi:hypothetical protein
MQNPFSHVDWHVLWQPKELLMVQPPNSWELMWGYVAFLVLSLIVFILMLVPALKLHETLKSRFKLWGITQVIIGALLFFFRFYQIPYLGMDLWRMILEVTALAWLISIAVYAYKKLPSQLIKEQAEARRNKYLPGQK